MLPDALFPPVFSADTIPVGTVVAFAGKIGESEPECFTTPVTELGWFPCDGRELLKGEYPQLFSVLGTVYGENGDKFCLPDYRGMFLRCVGKGDAELENRKAAAGGEAEDVGSVQQDGVMVHEHDYSSIAAQSEPVPAEQATAAGSASPPQSVSTSTGKGLVSSEKSGASEIKTSLLETRPSNVFVHYLIKFRYINGGLR